MTVMATNDETQKLLLPVVAVQQEEQQQIPTTIITTSTRTRSSPRSSPKKNSTKNDPSTFLFRRNSKFVKARLLLLDTTDTDTTTTTMMMATTSNTSRRSNIFFGVAGMAFFVVLFVTTRLDSIQAASSSSSNTNTNKSGYWNVYGQALQSCSSDGMALTGFTRSGSCVEETDDVGSHHICMDLSSTSSNADGSNFCQVTGQSNWCAYDDMPCHEDSTQTGCPVANWCVCQWAFSAYVLQEGCDQIQTIVCDAINLEAVLAYQKMIAQPSSSSSASSNYGQSQSKYQVALDCLVDRCGLDMNNFSTTAGQQTATTFFSSSLSLLLGRHGGSGGGGTATTNTVFLLAAFVVVLVGSIAGTLVYRKKSCPDHSATQDGLVKGGAIGKDFSSSTATETSSLYVLSRN